MPTIVLQLFCQHNSHALALSKVMKECRTDWDEGRNCVQYWTKRAEPRHCTNARITNKACNRTFQNCNLLKNKLSQNKKNEEQERGREKNLSVGKWLIIWLFRIGTELYCGCSCLNWQFAIYIRFWFLRHVINRIKSFVWTSGLIIDFVCLQFRVD